MTKRCVSCAGEKPLGDFSPAKANRDGLNGSCKSCVAAYMRERRRTNAGYREQCRAADLRWKAANPDKRRAYNASESKVASNKAWRERQHPDYNRVVAQASRARRIGVETALTLAEWVSICETFDGCCAYCLKPASLLEIEHMTPLLRGGTNTADNVVPACHACNTRKGKRTLVEFADAGRPS